MKANKNTSFFKMLASLVGVAGVSALINVPAFALTHLSESTTGSIHSQAVPPTDDTAPGTQPGEPSEPGQPGEPDRPGEPSEPDQPGKPGEPGQPGSEQD
ncbi:MULTISPECIES: hypothetical protein [Cyanophyceae]|uniref:Collagen-like protein n=1 Tax=Nodularia spumigena CENA596 TaxID=1819295 RepID=A0A166KWP4_NODSP|nr:MULTISPECIES: hypothetical protein [Cyanophyceae]MDB9358653.1 hypothetical protein [Nodularia spumigena CS-587/03]KZL51636.1 hypothetical protein A2T98_01240 [Nodularia spumigena CENA596]MDB9302816.1 hypothetical protein [Nodularia spumigena CS-591/12]MDB9319260.1 hypothetical protein [Nodularia spumigena CS-590/01A]MDB9323624.1 hypothetical protein [Nodularia spumigena CS-591/07A]